MTALTTALEAPYKPRHVRFIRREDVDGWQLKLYGIALNGKEPDPEFVDATRDLAAAVLPQPPAADDHYGVAFATAHDATSLYIALVYWWQSENELHQRIYVSPKDGAHRVRPGREPAGRLRLGARDRRLRAARVDRGRSGEPGRPQPRALPGPSRRQRRLARRRGSGGEVLGEPARAGLQPRPELAVEVLALLLGERSLRAPVAEWARVAPLAARAPLELAEHHRRPPARTPIFRLTPCCSIVLSPRQLRAG